MQHGDIPVDAQLDRNEGDPMPADDPVIAYLFERVEGQPVQPVPRYVPPPRSSGRLTNRRGGVWLPTFARESW